MLKLTYERGFFMLTKILSKEQCAQCKICCIFNDSDIWEQPIISEDLKDYISENLKLTHKYTAINNSYVFNLDKSDDNLYHCTMLNNCFGCTLKDDKPFDCKIWPFRVMNFQNNLVITLSPICPAISSLPINQIIDFLNTDSFVDCVFAEAHKNPDIVKPYIDGYPIFIIEKQKAE